MSIIDVVIGNERKAITFDKAQFKRDGDMYEQVKNPKENKTKAVANSVAQNKSIVKQGFGFVDNRPEVAAQRKLQKQTHKQSTYARQIMQLKSPVIQLHKGSGETDETLDDVIIYKVVLKSDDSVVYVGQTEDAVGIDTRFDQHLLTHTTWSKSTHKIVRLEAGSWTRFETDCAEQYWIDHFGGKESLENYKNQVSKARFERICQYQTDNSLTLFRGTTIGFPLGWKPAS